MSFEIDLCQNLVPSASSNVYVIPDFLNARNHHNQNYCQQFYYCYCTKHADVDKTAVVVHLIDYNNHKY